MIFTLDTMATITGFRCVNQKNEELPSDPFGNNVAFDCPKCGHPVLAIIRENQRGSDASHPAICRS